MIDNYAFLIEQIIVIAIHLAQNKIQSLLSAKLRSAYQTYLKDVVVTVVKVTKK